MRIISRKKIIDFCQRHGKEQVSLNAWYVAVKNSSFETFIELRRTFPSADLVSIGKGKKLTVFNIGGNNVRLIAAIHYNTQKLYIRHILTHAEYDKDRWKN